MAVKDIEFYSMCERRLLPFYGKAQVVHEPDGRVFRISKIVRLICKFARRLRAQERMTTQVADELFGHGVRGVLVILEAEHLCMKMRGVKNGTAVVTTAERGSLERPQARAAALSILKHYDNGGG